MDTETLNEYIFTDLVRSYALSVRDRRVDKMIDEGAPEDEADATPLTGDDFREGLRILESNRDLTFSILKESPAEPPAAD